MFGRGNKQPAAPKLPWALQFLTTDYLIAGTAAPEDYMLGSETIFYEACQNEGTAAFQLLSLSNVRLEPTGSLAHAPESLANWNLGLCDNLVAVIPDDDPSRAAAQAAYQDFQAPKQAVFYIGPYVISGAYQAEHDNDTVLFNSEKSLRPVAGTEITCRAPGSKLSGWQVPWLLINGQLLHGYQLT